MRLVTQTTLIAFCLLLTVSLTHAQEAAADQSIPFDVRKTGIVNVIKDPTGQISSIRLVVTSYEITLDEASKPLENMDGYKVRVTGAFNFDELKQRWITVKNIETIAKAPETTSAPVVTQTPEAEKTPATGTEEEAAAEAKPEETKAEEKPAAE